MTTASLHIGQRVSHPEYGPGTVRALTEHTAEIQFADGRRSVAPDVCGLQPAEPVATLTHLEMPLAELIRETAIAAVDSLGLEKPAASVSQLHPRWHKGKLVLHPEDPTLQTKEVPTEVFFHKIVMIRNQLRVLEQKINAHEKLAEAEKVEFQGYITRCYGSLTTFNVLFREKEDQF